MKAALAFWSTAASIGSATLAQEPQQAGEQTASEAPLVIDLTPPSSSLAQSEECGEQPLVIDVEALPEAPPGSDAGKIARGIALDP